MMIVALLSQSADFAIECRYDRAAVLALDLEAFDQNENGGWRQLQKRGCEAEAANLLRDWRITHKSRDYLLFWHEGQLRADLAQTETAIALFRRAHKPAAEDKGMGWNLYVDGTIAFLKRDWRAFTAAKRQLAALSRPKDFTMQGPDGKPMPIKWPLNLNVLEGLERCWAQSYKVAYECSQ